MYLVDIVHMEGTLSFDRFRHPETNILVAHGVLGVGHELSDLIVFELRDEARVCGPEQANVRDAEQHHGQSLQTQTKGPADLIWSSTIRHDLWMHYSATQHFQPLILEQDFEFEGRMSEGEELAVPPHLHIAKQVPGQSGQNLLQILLNNLSSHSHSQTQANKHSASRNKCRSVYQQFFFLGFALEDRQRVGKDTHSFHLMEDRVV